MNSSKQLTNVIKKLNQILPIFNLEDNKQYIQFQVPILVGQNEKERIDNSYLGVPPSYQKQIFLATIQLTTEYPQKYPSICLQKNLIYHPFISQQAGSVCLSTRDKEWKAENADQTLINLLTIGIPTLLGTFEGENPHNTDAAAMQKKSHKEYLEHAQQIYCKYKNECTDSKLAKLMRENNYKDYPQDFKARAQQLSIKLPELDYGIKIEAPKVNTRAIIADNEDVDLGL